LNSITMRGSIVGTRLDLQESLEFAERGKVKATVSTAKLEDINDIFATCTRARLKVASSSTSHPDGRWSATTKQQMPRPYCLQVGHQMQPAIVSQTVRSA